MVREIRLGAQASSLAAVVALACGASSGPVAAQALPSVSQPVVQPLPRRDGLDLNAALGRLARDPKDIDALVDAGNAALMMGDIEAATGFFKRADQVSPNNPRVKAGLAGAMVHNGDPFSAIALFEEAEKSGIMDGGLAADRGLAHDLVGDNASAQRFYRQSLARGPSDEVVRRLALSLAISGDRQGAEQTITPLLHQRNLSAWRTRAFSLAILGQTEEAVKVADTILPSELAASIAPYLRYMPRLTPAQQAAAANFCAFPRA
jgi:Flp pilus assembly protein TadD